MSTIKVNYKALSDAADNSRSVKKTMKAYSSEIESKITNKFSNLSGSDAQGYISAASKAATNKMNELNEKAAKAEAFGTAIDTFVTNAQNADKNVATKINQTGTSYVGKRNTFQKIGDWFYNTFCVDFANSNSITKLIANCFKWGADKVSALVENVKDWFKYKGGKYIWNIVKTTALVIAGIGAAVVAVITAGTALAIVAAVAACIVAVIGIVNGAISIYQNIKALKMQGEGKLGQARYHGSISGFSDAVDKYDMGDEATNKRWKAGATTVDTVQTVCEVVVAINGVTNLAGVKDPHTGKVTSYKFSKKNIVKNIKESLGIKKKRMSVDPETNKLVKYNGEKSGYKYKEIRKPFKSWKSIFGLGATDDAFYSRANGFSPNSKLTNAQKFNKLTTGQKVMKTVFDSSSVFSKNTGRIEKVYAVYEKVFKEPIELNNGWKSFKDASKTFMDVVSISDIYRPASLFKTVISPIDKIVWGTYDFVDTVVGN